MQKQPIPTKAFSELSAPVEKSSSGMIILIVVVIGIAIGLIYLSNQKNESDKANPETV